MRLLSLEIGQVKTLCSLHIGQSTAYIDGHETRTICQVYGDRTLIIVSQLGKVGYLTQVIPEGKPVTNFFGEFDRTTGAGASIESPVVSEGNSSNRDILGSTSKVLFGSHPAGKRALYELFASRIAAAVRDIEDGSHGVQKGTKDRPIVVGLSLAHERTPSGAGSRGDGGHSSDDADLALISRLEQARFRFILRLVREAYTQAKRSQVGDGRED